MSRIILKPLRSRKQLRKISFKDVVSAGFTDDLEQFFTISFSRAKLIIGVSIPTKATDTPKIRRQKPTMKFYIILDCPAIKIERMGLFYEKSEQHKTCF